MESIPCPDHPLQLVCRFGMGSPKNWDAIASGLIDVLFVFLDDATYEVPAALPELLFRQFSTKGRVSAMSRRLAGDLVRKASDRMQIEIDKVRRPPPTPTPQKQQKKGRSDPALDAAAWM